MLFALYVCMNGCGSTAAEPLPGRDATTALPASEPAAGREGTIVTEEDEWDDTDYRREYLETYSKPMALDTTITLSGTTYRMLLRHNCSFDSALVVPAKYNRDTKEDFITHNFYSTRTLLTESDTVFSRTIDRTVFDRLIYPEWRPYANLSNPSLELMKDSIQLRYSIGIPVTDLAEAISLRFDTKGNCQVFK